MLNYRIRRPYVSFDRLTRALVILLVVMVLFGGKKLADVGKGLGEGIRNFKTSLKGDDDDKKQG